MEQMHVISLGAGVQSTTMLLMAARGEIEPKPKYAIFADTGWEPTEVYRHLFTMKQHVKKFGIEVIITRRDRQLARQEDIREDTQIGAEDGSRFASMPFFTLDENGEKGMVMRQCTQEYKIAPIHREVRRLLGVGPRGRIPEGAVVMWMGISLDEIERMKPSRKKWMEHRFPLIEKNMDRVACTTWLRRNRYRVPPKSSCIGCPFHDDIAWLELKRNNPEEWMEAVYFDRKIRNLPKLKGQAFLHRSCVPLEEVDLSENQGTLDLFANECEGHCGL